jgi:fumarate reductase subunit C
MGGDWWFERGAYFRVLLRELTALPIALYLVLAIGLCRAILRDDIAYASYLSYLASPSVLAFHALALAASLLHTITWFNLTPKALALRVGEERLPPAGVAGAHYLVWLVMTGAVLWWVVD